jgi:hypothetical protein
MCLLLLVLRERRVLSSPLDVPYASQKEGRKLGASLPGQHWRVSRSWIFPHYTGYQGIW